MSLSQLLDLAGSLLGYSTIPLLAAAVALQARRPSAPYGRSFGAWLSMVVIIAIVGASILAATVADVPLQFSVWNSVALALVAILLRRDERFWLGFATLAVVYTAIGAVSIAGFRYNFDSSTTGWRGVRLLTSWAGPNANPESPEFSAAAVHLATARYGIPLAATVALGWTLARGRAATRIERLALMAVSGAFLADVLVGSTLSAITFAAGGINGLPLGLTAAGIAASVFMLFTVGPGALVGIVTGARSLVSARSQYDTIETLRSTLSGAIEEGGSGLEFDDEGGSTIGSLVRYLRGEVGWLRKLNLAVIVLAALFIGASSLVARGMSDDDKRWEFAYEYVDDEVAVDDRVERALPAGDGSIWLVHDDDRLVRFAPSDRSFTELDTPIVDAMIDPATAENDTPLVVAITAEDPPRLVTVQPDGELIERLSFESGTSLRLGASLTTLYVAETTGRLMVIDGDAITHELTVEPLEVVVGSGDSMWTLHTAGADVSDERIKYLAVQRDTATLEPIGGGPASESMDGIIWEGRNVYLPRTRSMASTEGTIAVGSWAYGYMGRSEFVGFLQTSRYYFHYDMVLAHVTGPDGTWVVTDDWRGIGLTPRSEPQSYVVHWPASPFADSDSADADTGDSGTADDGTGTDENDEARPR